MLRATIRHTDHHVEATFVAVGTQRAPARRQFANEAAARAWVECEAQAISAEVEWVD